MSRAPVDATGTPYGTPAGQSGRSAPGYGPPESYRRRALLALAVAVLGVAAFLVGMREAVRRIPSDAEARAAARADSARADSVRRVREAGAPARPGVRGGGPGGGTQAEELPRLR